jgi:hypothetical protein
MKTLIAKFKAWRDCKKRESHERDILKRCGCVCWCPKCSAILQDGADWGPSSCEDGLGEYDCRSCGTISQWHFGIAPSPIMLRFWLSPDKLESPFKPTLANPAPKRKLHPTPQNEATARKASGTGHSKYNAP